MNSAVQGPHQQPKQEPEPEPEPQPQQPKQEPEPEPEPEPQPLPESLPALPQKVPSKNTSPAVSPIIHRSNRQELSVVTRFEEKGRRENLFAGDGERRSRVVSDILRRARREKILKRTGFGLRVCSLVFCLISFAVMAADKTKGWTGDSFDRYKEYRYCISVTILAFVYSGFQVFRRVNQFITGKDIIPQPIHFYFDFSMDQSIVGETTQEEGKMHQILNDWRLETATREVVFAYLLISASSSAATRTDIWVSDWGNDKFTGMIDASLALSFLAFAAFSLSSLISGYNLCNRNH